MNMENLKPHVLTASLFHNIHNSLVSYVGMYTYNALGASGSRIYSAVYCAQIKLRPMIYAYA